MPLFISWSKIIMRKQQACIRKLFPKYNNMIMMEVFEFYATW